MEDADAEEFEGRFVTEPAVAQYLMQLRSGGFGPPCARPSRRRGLLRCGLGDNAIIRLR